MQRDPGVSYVRAFTLLETLAVSALLALLAAVAIGSVGALRETLADRQALRELSDMEVRARLAARRGGAVTLRVESLDGRDTLTVRRVTAAPDEAPLLRRDVPDGVWITLRAPRGSGELRIDAAGRSDDYEFVVRTAQGTRVLRVAGLTGIVTNMEFGGSLDRSIERGGA